MNSIILYGSRYGCSKSYAENLMEMTGISCEDVENFTEYTKYQRYIYIGSLYIGKVRGLKKFLKNYSKDKELILAVVGLGNPEDEEILKIREEQLARGIDTDLLYNISIYHLKGAMDYSRMSFIHRILMKGLCSQIKKTPFEERTEMEQSILDSYNSKIDTMDYSDLEPIRYRLNKN